MFLQPAGQYFNLNKGHHFVNLNHLHSGASLNLNLGEEACHPTPLTNSEQYTYCHLTLNVLIFPLVCFKYCIHLYTMIMFLSTYVVCFLYMIQIYSLKWKFILIA